METFELITLIILSVVMIISAVMAVLSKEMPLAILASGAISLLASIFFLCWHPPMLP